MSDNFFTYWGIFIGLGVAATFGWHAVRGLRTGTIRIPVRLIGDDEYERGETMFGFAVLMNILGSVLGVVFAWAIWRGAL